MRLRVIGIVCGVALTACGTTSAPSGPALPHSGAPSVVHPLDGTALAQDPCGAMTQDEADATLGGTVLNTAPNTPTTGQETGCAWTLDEGLGTVVAGPSVNIAEGLSTSFQASQAAVAAGKPPTVKELPAVEGYPTVQSTENAEGPGVCVSMTGLSDTQLYVVKVQMGDRNPGYADPCGLAVKVAALAVDKVKDE